MDPKWLIIQEILKSIGSKHAQKIASRLKIPDVQVFLDCMKILTLADAFELEYSYVISEIKVNNKLKCFMGLNQVLEVEYLYRFVSKLGDHQLKD